MLLLLFLAGLFFTLTMPILIPILHLLYFPPFLIRCLYTLPLNRTLWFAALSGLIIDLLSPNEKLGLNSASYVITLLLLTRAKRHFFEDNLSTLPILVFFFSAIQGGIHLVLTVLIARPVPITPEFLLGDLILMPFLDALFASLFFTLPYSYFRKPQRRGQDYFR
jgi:rod shape-determining protein MreD